MITKQRILNDYVYFKKLAERELLNDNLMRSISCIEIACKIAYQINFIFVDYELEGLIQKISSKLLPKNAIATELKKVVFYDCFASSNRGLTQQYLRALVKLDVEILFIAMVDPSNLDARIKKEFSKYKNVEIACISQNGMSLLEQINLLYAEIVKFSPSKAFFHMTPWDVVGNVVWNAFPEVERYQINLTDHAFWLGIKCSDYFLEFRNYGYNLSWQYRGIGKDKLLLLPFYPITESTPFQGLPETTYPHTVKLFSGGAVYKVYGRDGLFLEIIRDILNRNPHTVFYYAGSGDMRVMRGFISKNELQNRWVLLGNRNDIVEVMKQMDIYIGTYPLNGGLMTQIAAMAEIPVISYLDRELTMTDVREMFVDSSNIPEISYSDLNLFHKEIDNLIKDKGLRQKMGRDLYSCLMTPEIFNSDFGKLITAKINKYTTHEIEINTKAICDYYIDNEKKMLHQYPRLLINKIYAKKKPLNFIFTCCIYFFYVDKIRGVHRAYELIIQKLSYFLNKCIIAL